MYLLEINPINKAYGMGDAVVDALKNAAISAAKGEFAAAVGESDSGKSTLLNMIGALDMPTSGKVLPDGKDIFTIRDEALTIFRRRNIGFIFQSFNLIPKRNVEQNITFPLLPGDQKPKEEYLEEILSALNLKEQPHHLPRQLSGGQQQQSDCTAKKASRNYEQTIIRITHNRSIVFTADRVLQVSDSILTDIGGVPNE